MRKAKDNQPPVTARDHFLAALKEISGSIGQNHRLGEGVVLVNSGEGTPFEMGDNEVYLVGIMADKPRNGQGGQTLDILGGLADKYDVDIVTHPAGSPRGISTEKLRDFFAAHGFVAEAGSTGMIRPAHPVESTALSGPKAP